MLLKKLSDNWSIISWTLASALSLVLFLNSLSLKVVALEQKTEPLSQLGEIKTDIALIKKAAERTQDDVKELRKDVKTLLRHPNVGAE